MKKSISLIASLFALSLMALPAQAALKFDLSQVHNIFSDSRVEGVGRHVGINFDLNDDVDLGIYVERTDAQWTADVGATPPNTTHLHLDMQAIRLMKRFGKYLSAGLDMGSVKIQQGAFVAGVGANAALNQNKPFVGLLGGASYSVSVSDRVSTEFGLTLGYRMIDLNDVAVTAVAGESTLDDLNSFNIGLGVGLRF
jgi:hypothetical protein